MSSILDSLLKQSAVADKTVNDAKSNLTDTPKVELVGVNAPEFESATQGDTGVDFDALSESCDTDTENPREDPMEQAYASKSQSPIRLPMHDDGLDDDDDMLTEYHTFTQAEDVVEAENTTTEREFLPQDDSDGHKAQNEIIEEVLGEDGEPVAWNRKPFTSNYFNFGGRTINSLARENLSCFDDIRGWAYSELKAIKGFGQGCLDELLEILEAEEQVDWLIKRKRKEKVTVADNVVSQASTSIEARAEAPRESVSVPTDELTSEENQAGLGAAEDVSTDAIVSEMDAQNGSGAAEVISNDEQVDSLQGHSRVRDHGTIKILVMGNSSAMNGKVRVATFEQVYAEAIREICAQCAVPSISMVDYNKGWQALASVIRQNGWPQDVDALNVSKSFMSRSEILLELRLLADLVIDG